MKEEKREPRNTLDVGGAVVHARSLQLHMYLTYYALVEADPFLMLRIEWGNQLKNNMSYATKRKNMG